MKKEKRALVLGGGGARGAYEIGVWKALIEEKIEFDIVTGASVGAINAAAIAQGDYPLAEKLWSTLETEMVLDAEVQEEEKELKESKLIKGMSQEEVLSYLKDIVLRKGIGTESLHGLLRSIIREEKVRESSVLYGLVTVRLANLKKSKAMEALKLFVDEIEEGKLHDFIMASASLYPAMKAYEIDGYMYVDGGYADPIPIEMAMERGATKVIAVDLKMDNPLIKTDTDKLSEYIHIKSEWDLGNLLIFNKENSKRLLDLGYWETKKALGKYYGNYFTFKKEDFTEKDVLLADAAAHAFSLDPRILYDKKSFKDTFDKTLRECRNKKPSLENTRCLVILKTAEAIKAMKKETQEAFMEHEGILLKQEQDAVKYLVAHMMEDGKDG